MLAGELGFGQLMVQVYPSPDPEPEMWWKEAVVRNLLKDPVVSSCGAMTRWSGRTHRPGWTSAAATFSLPSSGTGFLPICPDPNAGLQVEHLDEIGDFLARGSGLFGA